MLQLKRKLKSSLYLRIFGTALCVVLYLILSCVKLPFISDSSAAYAFGEMNAGGMLGIITGGNLSEANAAALGIMPYITASIFMQFASIIIKPLGELQRAGELGKKKLRKIMMWMSAVIGVFSAGKLTAQYMSSGVLMCETISEIFFIIFILTFCSCFLTYLGNIITDKFFGDGISILLVTGILKQVPQTLRGVLYTLNADYESVLPGIGFIIFMILVFMAVCYVNSCKQSYDLSYDSYKVEAKIRPVESKLRFKVLTTGVMPVVFASSFISLPLMFSLFATEDSAPWLDMFNPGKWFGGGSMYAPLGVVIYCVMIFMFSRLSQMLSLNEAQITDHLRRSGCIIKGVKPGAETAVFLKSELKQLNRLGSTFLCFIAIVPPLLRAVFHMSFDTLLGTSMIIVVVVMMDICEAFAAEIHSVKAKQILRDIDSSRTGKEQFALFRMER